jgi:2-iminobutanoate/2-iminopropanoate deaminase
VSHRQAIKGGGIPEHPQPFPAAVRVGNMVFTSALGGQDALTGDLPDSVADQAANALNHLKTALQIVGGSLGDVAKVSLYLTDRADREQVNPVWVACFPDPEDRPVRHTTVGPLPGGMRVQVEAVAVLRR